jgi:phosphatidylglycerol:prolipoprotein diacylglycerol transferase
MDLILSHTNGDWYYHLFYQLAAISGFLIYLWFGIKRKYPMHNWVLISVAGFVFFTLGMRIGTLSIEEWKFFVADGNLPLQTGQTSIGGLVGFFLAIWMVQKALKSNYPVFDVFAFTIPVVLIIQRAGCLLAGCCFGTPTNGTFGVQYAQHFPIYTHHQIEDLIATDAAHSAAIHPVPIYLIVVSILCLSILLPAKKRLRKPGSLFALSIFILASGRFFVEFFRDPITNHQLGDYAFGLKKVQWIIMAISLIALLSVFLLEKYGNQRSKILKERKGIFRPLIISIALILIVLPLTSSLDTAEVENLFFRFVFLGCAFLYFIIQEKEYLHPSFAYLLVPLFAVVWMGQTVDPKLKTKARIVYETGTHEIGFSGGNITGTEREYSGTGCNARLIKVTEYESKSSFGYFYDHSRVKDNGNKSKLGIGLNVTNTMADEYNPSGVLLTQKNKPGIAVSTAFGIDNKYMGFRAGFWVGQIYLYNPRPYRSETSVSTEAFFPILNLRLGSLDGVSVSGSVGDDYIFGTYRYTAKVGIGVNLSGYNKPEQSLYLGYTDRDQFNLEGNFSISEQIAIHPSVFLGDDTQWGIGIKYRPSLSNK